MDADKSVTANFAVDTIPVTERDALIALYTSTNGGGWTNSSGWKTAPLYTDGFAMPGTEGSWHGIAIDAGTLRVTSIDLSNNNLTGAIPPEIGGFSNLKSLLLSRNSIGGTIPAALASLTALETISLDYNALSGSIPAELGDLTNLITLSLQRNQLSGPIPTELGDLTNLQTLNLESNHLSGGIPTTFGDLTQLNLLALNSNMLSGSIPLSLANLTALNPAGTDFGYNALYATGPALIAFLDSKDRGLGFDADDRPDRNHCDGTRQCRHSVSWLPVTYTADGGYYKVFISQTPGGTYTLAGQTADKATTAVNVTGLAPGQRYYLSSRLTPTPTRATRMRSKAPIAPKPRPWPGCRQTSTSPGQSRWAGCLCPASS